MIVKADVEVHHLKCLELGDICVFIQKGYRRIKITKALTHSHYLIVKEAAKELLINAPSLALQLSLLPKVFAI